MEPVINYPICTTEKVKYMDILRLLKLAHMEIDGQSSNVSKYIFIFIAIMCYSMCLDFILYVGWHVKEHTVNGLFSFLCRKEILIKVDYITSLIMCTMYLVIEKGDLTVKSVVSLFLKVNVMYRIQWTSLNTDQIIV